MSGSACPENNQVDRLAQALIRYGFHLDTHVPGLVDAYSGPPSLPREVTASGALSLPAIREGVASAIAEVQEVQEVQRGAPLSEKHRLDYLLKHFIALRTLVAVQLDDAVSFVDEVEGIYDVRPSRVPTEELDESIKHLNVLLEGTGSLQERLRDLRKSLEIPTDLVAEMFQHALLLARERTAALFPLPAGEDFVIEIVRNKPWSGYHWYLGNYRSRIEVNVDVPRRVDELLHLMTHEGYPGHHTEATIKDAELYHKKGFVECTLRLLFAPQSVIAEGIAELAEEVIFSRDDRIGFLQDYALPRIGRSDIDAARIIEIQEALRGVKGAMGNAAFMLFEDKVPAEEVEQYLTYYGLMEPAFAAKRLEFLNAYRGYSFVYSHGYRLLKSFLSRGDFVSGFRDLVMTARVPSSFAAV